MTTLQTLLRDVAHKLNGHKHYPVTGTATGGSAETLIDAVALKYVSGAANNFDHKYIYNETGFDTGRVTEAGYAGSTGTLSFSPAITTFGTGTPKYIITDDPPAMIKEAINEVLRTTDGPFPALAADTDDTPADRVFVVHQAVALMKIRCGEEDWRIWVDIAGARAEQLNYLTPFTALYERDKGET